MHFLNLFKGFGVNSSLQDVHGAGEAEITIPSPRAANNPVRKRRVLKRRATKRSANGYQPEETRSLSGIQVPTARNEGFRSAPNLLTEAQVRHSSWSPKPVVEERSLAKGPYNRLQENSDSGSYREHEPTFPADFPPNSYPARDDASSYVESPVFGPREQGLFRNEIPYDMESPLSQLASDWQESPRMPRRLPTPPLRDRSFQNADMASIHTKELPQQRDSPEARHPYRSSSLDPFRRYESRHSPEVVPQFKELPPGWRGSPEIRQAQTAVSQAASPHRPDSCSQRSSNAIDGTYYIVPRGVDVIFQDQDGNEITRVGDFKNERRGETSHRHSGRSYDEEFGHGRGGRRNPRSRSAESRSSESWDSDRSRGDLPTIILIDRRGRQIPIMPFNFNSDRRSE